jgi:hypothetical protein
MSYLDDEVTKVEAALRGDAVKAKTFYAAHKKAVLIGAAVVAAIVLYAIFG